MKCEMCHEGEAKHQAFRNDGAEVYVCEDCFNKMIEDAATEALKEAPTEDCFEGFPDREKSKDLNEAVVSTLLELRKAVGKPFSFRYEKDIAGTELGAKCLFDSLEKKITLSFNMKDDEINKETWAKWIFDVTDKENVKMTGKVHYGNATTPKEEEFRFKDLESMPREAQAVLVYIIGGLAASKDELECDFK